MTELSHQIYLTFDLEDFTRLRRRHLGLPEVAAGAEIEAGVDRFLAALPAGSTCTFFTTGNIARTRPALVRRLAELGHVIGCHGDEHEDISRLDRAAFRRILDEATKALEDACGREIPAFRAPSFRLPADPGWFFDELAARGYRVDSSLLLEGPRAPGEPFDRIQTPSGELLEFPLYRLKLPLLPPIRVVGGTYFRFLPRGIVHRLLESARRRGFVPVLWLHASDLAPLAPATAWSEAAAISPREALLWPIEQMVQRLGAGKAGEKLGGLLGADPSDNALKTQAII